MGIEIDKRELTVGLSFLIGKVIVFRSTDGFSTTKVNSIEVKGGTSIHVNIYSGMGVQTLNSSKEFKNIMLIDDGELKCVYDILDEKGIVF